MGVDNSKERRERQGKEWEACMHACAYDSLWNDLICVHSVRLNVQVVGDLCIVDISLLPCYVLCCVALCCHAISHLHVSYLSVCLSALFLLNSCIVF